MHKRAFRRRVGVARAFLLQEEDRGKRKSKMDCAFPNRLGASRKTCSKPLENVCVGCAPTTAEVGSSRLFSCPMTTKEERKDEGDTSTSIRMPCTRPNRLCYVSLLLSTHTTMCCCGVVCVVVLCMIGILDTSSSFFHLKEIHLHQPGRNHFRNQPGWKEGRKKTIHE